jgi:asparagine synthase (glutamine-hydrolysing)
VEYCLSVPTGEYLSNGVPRSLGRRALADRVANAVLTEHRKGYQAADYHEGLTCARGEIAAELDRIETCPAAASAIDILRLKKMVNNWPGSGWERPEITQAYRYALLRGISAGHFLRKASEPGW